MRCERYCPVLCSAHFRIAILQNAYRGRGLGAWEVQSICSFVFDELKISCLLLMRFAHMCGVKNFR